ncbi:MAG: LarC family nickel insertion protein, partial [bacterium]|nr:LarC family nickel insertion protein [bacterium]
TVVTEPARRPELTKILFAETTTLGLRCHEVERACLERKSVKVSTRYGKVSVKLGLSEGEVVNAAPEFEDCRLIASAKKVSLKEVQQAALAAFRKN